MVQATYQYLDQSRTQLVVPVVSALGHIFGHHQLRLVRLAIKIGLVSLLTISLGIVNMLVSLICSNSKSDDFIIVDHVEHTQDVLQ